MIKVGITGQSGFIGTHLFNTLGLCPDRFERIPFEDSFFEDEPRLNNFVRRCDTIVHLAALNRHYDPQVIYDTNLLLVKKLITACERTGSKPHIIFASSTQEDLDNPYGRSKKEGRILFGEWAERNNARFTGLIIPNVFGPFGHPYYNSVVATFCHQFTHNEQPVIETDKELSLIYVGELTDYILKAITDGTQMTQMQLIDTDQISANPYNQCHPCAIKTIRVSPTCNIRVSDLLKKITDYKELYFEKGIVPDLSDPFDRKLFNTFVCYIDHESFFPFPLDMKTDTRGSFTEVAKFFSGGQVSFSTTKPGITRGNHFHTRKAERFTVIKGKARIQLRRIGTDKVMTFDLDGSRPAFVDMPVWHTHNITNTGTEDLFTIFWISEHYNPDDPDTYLGEV